MVMPGVWVVEGGKWKADGLNGVSWLTMQRELKGIFELFGTSV
jgi:hypothetical protein